MPLSPPYPSLLEMMRAIGAAGSRLTAIGASEGAAGNISVYIGWRVEPLPFFSQVETIAMPYPAPALAGGCLLVTGSGRRLREIAADPLSNLGFVTVDPGGQTGKLRTASSRAFARLTSEFNSHLAAHQAMSGSGGSIFHALVHAQPLHLTYLSHIPRYQDPTYLNRHVLRWQPEAIINLPEGIGVLPFEVPGSPELMRATLQVMCAHRLVLWGQHGVIARSDESVLKAADLIEYAETGAHYEVLNLANGEQAKGLSPEQIRAVAASLNIKQDVF